MTIKEIEELSGMTRANIRFYEKEKLLTPGRDPNGYRNYTNNDLDVLKRIRLLRTLHLSIEDIRSLSRGELRLTDVLTEHLRTLDAQQKELEASAGICRQLCLEQASYGNLDAQRWLDQIASGAARMPAELEEDSVPKVRSPWVRYFARFLDMSLYQLLWYGVLSIRFHINIIESSISSCLVDGMATLILVLLLEPVLLHFFRTTPGKFVFGLRVTAETGENLTWKEALHRIWLVLRKGYGLLIPIYGLVREYKSYKACRDGQTLAWEEESSLTLDTGRVSLGVLTTIAGCAALVLIYIFIWQAGALPGHTGDITAAQYAENFNDIQRFYGTDRQLNLPEYIEFTGIDDSMLLLDESGGFVKQPYSSYITDTAADFAPLPQFRFEEENGFVTGVSFSATYESEKIEIVSMGDLMAVSTLAFVCAQEDYSVFSRLPSMLYERIASNGDSFSGFTLQEAGVTVTCTVESSGYALREADWSTTPVLVPEYGEEPYFHIDFSLKKQ